MTATQLEQPATPVCLAASCAHQPAPGALLCAVDIGKLGDWLAIISTQYELLSAVPTMAGREIGTIGGSTLASHRSPGITAVIAMRDPRRGTGRIAYDDADPWGVDDTPSVLGILTSYADRVREGRELQEEVTYVRPCLFPCMHRACLLGMGHPVRVPLTVERERGLLTEKNNFRWIVLQDWAGEFFDEIRGLRAALLRANGHAAPARQVRRLQAPCPACGVRAVTHRHGEQLMECQNCHSRQPYESDAERVSA